MSAGRHMSIRIGLRSATSTLRVSGMEDDGELLSYSERTLHAHELVPASETTSLTARNKDYKYETYLKRTVGFSLKQCLQDMTEVKPEDPIEYIAHALYKYAESEFYRRQKLDFLQKLIVTRDQMRKEEECRLGHLNEIRNSIQEQRNLFDEIRRAELDDLMTILIKYNLPFGDFENRLLELAEIYGQGDIVRNVMKVRARALASGTNRNLERMLDRLLEQYEQRNAYQMKATASQTGADGWDPVLGLYKLVNGVKVPLGKLMAGHIGADGWDPVIGAYKLVNGVKVPMGKLFGEADGWDPVIGAYKLVNGVKVPLGSPGVGVDSEEDEGDEEEGSSDDSLAEDWFPGRRRRGKAGKLPPIPGQESVDSKEAKRQRHLARIRDKILADMEEGHFIVDKRGQLIFLSNDLGVISPRPPTVKYSHAVDNPSEWTAKGFRCEALYDPELYTVCDARPDDWSDYPPFMVRMSLSEFTRHKLPPILRQSSRNSSIASDDAASPDPRRASNQSKGSHGSTSSKH